MRISTAEFIKDFGVLADKALGEPVRITKHGRDRLVISLAAETGDHDTSAYVPPHRPH